jgi:transposase-like protein
MFKHHCFPNAVIPQAVYFKLRFTLSYRDVEELMQIRGVDVDHATIQGWVFKFNPPLERERSPLANAGEWMRLTLKSKVYGVIFIEPLIMREKQLIFY